MEKRYQVFVSSTYADLKEERGRVVQTISELDCIPAGMELFPAVDEEQLAFIKRVIDDCDYYIVIVGGRYGSCTPDGVSFTEQEYAYALERGLKVLAFIHESPEKISMENSEKDPAAREKLGAFRERLAQGRMVKFWKEPSELPGLVAMSLIKTMKLYPAQGWVRASQEPREALLEELATVRRSNDKLQAELRQLRAKPVPEIVNLASLDEPGRFSGRYTREDEHYEAWSCEISWGDLFALVAPYLMDGLSEGDVSTRIARELMAKTGTMGSYPSLDQQVFQTIKIQLLALRLIAVRTVRDLFNVRTHWTLTALGTTTLFERRTVRAKAQSDA